MVFVCVSPVKANINSPCFKIVRGMQSKTWVQTSKDSLALYDNKAIMSSRNLAKNPLTNRAEGDKG